MINKIDGIMKLGDLIGLDAASDVMDILLYSNHVPYHLFLYS